MLNFSGIISMQNVGLSKKILSFLCKKTSNFFLGMGIKKSSKQAKPSSLILKKPQVFTLPGRSPWSVFIVEHVIEKPQVLLPRNIHEEVVIHSPGHRNCGMACHTETSGPSCQEHPEAVGHQLVQHSGCQVKPVREFQS